MEIVIFILIFFIAVLIIYNININKKIQNLNSVNKRVADLNVLQEFMSTIGEDESVENKIKKINDILIEKYSIKYSSIVIFDGAEYAVKATNVDEKHWDTLRNLQNQEIFKDSITTGIPKYITINNDKEKLPYQTSEFGRAKTAIFLPLYIDNIYIGYWIIESGIAHDYEKLDTTILEVIKDNILSVLKSVSYQTTVESLVREDLYSGLNNVEYLYGKGKKIIDRYPTSAVCMFNIINLEQINEEIDRKTGNNVITEISEYIKDNISEQYLFVRYMGPKFVIVFSGVDVESVEGFLERIKTDVERMKFEKENEKGKSKKKISISPKLNFVATTYYKGTALEGLTIKMEEYLNNADKDESDINLI